MANSNKNIDQLSLANFFLVVVLLLLFLMPGWVLYQLYYVPHVEKTEKAKLVLEKERQQKMKLYLEEVAKNKVVDGVHISTGLIADKNYKLVVQNCTSCHSAQLIIQNKATRDNWVQIIDWMQKTQNLWDLGESEKPIIDYLSKNYSPTFQGRRAPLSTIEWYELNP